METIRVSHVSRWASHLRALAWVFTRYQSRRLSSDTLVPGAPGGGLLSAADRCATANTRSSGLAGVGAHVRWKLHVRPALTAGKWRKEVTNGTWLFAEIAGKTSNLNNNAESQHG